MLMKLTPDNEEPPSKHGGHHPHSHQKGSKNEEKIGKKILNNFLGKSCNLNVKFKLKMHCNTRFQRAFTACGWVFKVIT